MKELYFTSGMPRSGSTLIQAILDQNPDFHGWVTSALPELLIGVRNQWDGLIEHKAIDFNISTLKKKETLRGILDSYYADRSEDYIFDKSRAWLAHIETLEWVLEKPVKILVPVRDLREILTSMELLWRNTSKESQIAQESTNYTNMQTVVGRCHMWMQPNQPVGLAYNRINDALLRGYRDRLHFVHYEELCNDPQSTINAVYDFLGLPIYKHDFNNIVKNYVENDRVHGLLNLHSIQPKIKPNIPKSNAILGAEVAKQYAGKYPWSM